MEKLKDVLKSLECSVCFHLMVPPITMCSNGHSICHICKPRLDHCPTCRGNLIDVRNKIVEDMSKSFVHPCRYQASGCSPVLVFGPPEEHEKKCRYGPHKCPFYIVYRIKCKWEGTSSQLEEHIRNDHRERNQVTVKSGKQPYSIPNYTKYIYDGSWAQLVFTLHSIFFSYSKIIGNYIHMCYMFVGAREDDSNYKYSVSMKTADGKQNATMTLECPHYQEFIEGEFPNSKCAVFYKDFTIACVNQKDELPFEFEILRS